MVVSFFCHSSVLQFKISHAILISHCIQCGISIAKGETILNRRHTRDQKLHTDQPRPRKETVFSDHIDPLCDNAGAFLEGPISIYLKVGPGRNQFAEGIKQFCYIAIEY